MTRQFLALGLALLGVLVAVACRREQPPPPAAPPSVAVTAVQRRDLVDRIEATGELLARDRAQIAAEVGGRVTQIRIDEGLAAESGAVVVEIDPERRQLDLRSAEAHLAEARAGFARDQREVLRIRKLSRRGVASRTQLDRAETAFSLARSRLEAADAQVGVARRALRDASVTAPFSGLIARRVVSPGEFVRAGQPLFELVARDPIEVEFHLAEIDSSRVALANQVTVRVSPYPDEVFHAEVTFVSPTIDPRTRTLRVKAVMANPEGKLRPGLFARVDLGVSTREAALMVPEEAVLRRADGSVLFVLEGDRVTRRRVETGTHTGTEVEIRAGLTAGETVVTRGHAELVDGGRVRVREAGGAVLNPAVADGPRGNGQGG